MRFDMQGLRRLVKASRWRFGVAVLVALLCGLVIGAVLPWHGAVSKAVGKDTPTPLALPDPVHLSSAFASIVATVEPAVVNISTTQVHRTTNQPRMPRGFQNPFGDFWNRFFDYPNAGPVAEHSLGSGENVFGLNRAW